MLPPGVRYLGLITATTYSVEINLSRRHTRAQMRNDRKTAAAGNETGTKYPSRPIARAQSVWRYAHQCALWFVVQYFLAILTAVSYV